MEKQQKGKYVDDRPGQNDVSTIDKPILNSKSRPYVHTHTHTHTPHTHTHTNEHTQTHTHTHRHTHTHKHKHTHTHTHTHRQTAHASTVKRKEGFHYTIAIEKNKKWKISGFYV